VVVAGRHRSIAFFTALGAGLVLVTILLYVGWVLLNWRTGILLFAGVLLLALIIAGVALNTIFLVREIRRNERHDAFINAVTHELKTPVASIRLYLDTLLTHPVEDSKRTEFYRVMLDDSKRLLATIEQILRAGRLGHPTRVLNSVPIDLNALVEQCLSQARTLYSLEPDSLRYHPGPAIRVKGDPDEIQAAVSNLIDNAVKYSGRDVQVDAETAQLDERHAIVRVRDRGVGIPEKQLKAIFRRFYRIPGPVAMRLKGTGLGLYIVRSVAKRHGGRVWAESDGPGQGSTFFLQLPMLR